MLSDSGIGLKVLTGQGAAIDTTTAAGRLSFGIFAALAEFESELIRERTMAGLQAARARGRKGGRKFALTKAQVHMAQAAMASRDTSVSKLCEELGVRPVTLYRYVDPNGNLRDYGKRVLSSQRTILHSAVVDPKLPRVLNKELETDADAERREIGEGATSPHCPQEDDGAPRERTRSRRSGIRAPISHGIGR